MLTPRWLSRLTKEVRSSRGVQPSPIPAAVQTRLNIFRTLAASRAAPWWLVKTSPVSCQPFPAASRSSAWLPAQARSAWTAAAGRPRVRRDRSVLVSPWVRTDRQTAMCGGTGGLAAGSPSRLTWASAGRHRGQCLPHVGGREVAELAGADDLQDRLQDVLVLLDGLG